MTDEKIQQMRTALLPVLAFCLILLSACAAQRRVNAWADRHNRQWEQECLKKHPGDQSCFEHMQY